MGQIAVDNTVNTFQNVQVCMHNSNITWGKQKCGVIFHLKINYYISQPAGVYTGYLVVQYGENIYICDNIFVNN